MKLIVSRKQASTTRFCLYSFPTSQSQKKNYVRVIYCLIAWHHLPRSNSALRIPKKQPTKTPIKSVLFGILFRVSIFAIARMVSTKIWDSSNGCSINISITSSLSESWSLILWIFSFSVGLLPRQNPIDGLHPSQHQHRQVIGGRHTWERYCQYLLGEIMHAVFSLLCIT